MNINMCQYVGLGIKLVLALLAITVNPGIGFLILLVCPICKVVAGLLGKECCGSCDSKETCTKGTCAA